MCKSKEYYMKYVLSLLLLFFAFAAHAQQSADYYTPTIDNLRFREGPSVDSRVIRMFNENEKLMILEKGKTESINNVTGTWVKVKTEKNEIGWCFDAYLMPYEEPPLQLAHIARDQNGIEAIAVNWIRNIKDYDFIYLNHGELELYDLSAKKRTVLTSTQNRIASFDLSGDKSKILFSLADENDYGAYQEEFKDDVTGTQIWEIDFVSKKIKKIIGIYDFVYRKKESDAYFFFSKIRYGIFALKYDPDNSGDFIFWQNDMYYYKRDKEQIARITVNEHGVPAKVKWRGMYIIIDFVPYEGAYEKIFKKNNGRIIEADISKREGFFTYATTNRVLGFIGDHKAVIMQSGVDDYGGVVKIVDLHKESYISEFRFSDLRYIIVMDNKIVSFIDPKNNSRFTISGIDRSSDYGLYEILLDGSVQKHGDFSGIPPKYRVIGDTEGYIADGNIFYGVCYAKDKAVRDPNNRSFFVYKMHEKEFILIERISGFVRYIDK
jgi:hypothetical protein